VLQNGCHDFLWENERWKREWEGGGSRGYGENGKERGDQLALEGEKDGEGTYEKKTWIT
jgi:hypothetical protein